MTSISSSIESVGASERTNRPKQPIETKKLNSKQKRNKQKLNQVIYQRNDQLQRQLEEWTGADEFDFCPQVHAWKECSQIQRVFLYCIAPRIVNDQKSSSESEALRRMMVTLMMISQQKQSIDSFGATN